MAVARSHECPNCGGLVRENARTCGFCRSPLATVRCCICFAMNVSVASYCLACGTELGLEPLAVDGEARLSCPRCTGRSLDGFSNGDGPLYDCAGCGGQFVDPQTLRTMVERHRARSDGGGGSSTSRHRETRVAYLRCPVCRELMHRRNFGRTSGVIVDVCEIHGTWFDVGELPWILGFVARGGPRTSATRGTRRERAADQGPASPPCALLPGRELLDGSVGSTKWAGMS
jgi:Zn-finger nucleic acid-binding protein